MSADSDDGGPTKAELKHRVDQLEETVAQMLPNRRQFMKGAAAAGAAGAIGFGAGAATADPSTSDSDGNVGTPSNRVDLFAEGIDSQTQEHTQPSGTYTWQDVQWIRAQGDVVASDGNVYQGASAIQDALNAIGDNAVVLAGARTYDPVTVDNDSVIIRGHGRSTVIASTSADTHALTLSDTGGGSIARVQVHDVTLDTSGASGNSDCLHTTTPNGNQVFESWFYNIQMQGGGGRYGVNLNGNATGMYFHGLFGEGFDDNVFVTGGSSNETHVMGADLATNADTQVLSLAGNNAMIVANTLGKPSGVPAIEFLSGTFGNMVIGTARAFGTPTDNGTENVWMLRDSMKLPESRYAPSNVTTDRTFDANSTTVDELADIVGTMIADLGLDS